MAITIRHVPDGEDVWGRMRVRFTDVALDTSYPTGGYPIAASDVGMKMIYSVKIVGQNAGSEAWLFDFLIANAIGSATAKGVPATTFNLKAFTAINTQVGNAVDVSAAVLRLEVVGR